jgi:hypothetical protein
MERTKFVEIGLIIFLIVLGTVGLTRLNTRINAVDEYIGFISKNFYLTKEYESKVLTYNAKVVEYNNKANEIIMKQQQLP